MLECHGSCSFDSLVVDSCAEVEIEFCEGHSLTPHSTSFVISAIEGRKPPHPVNLRNKRGPHSCSTETVGCSEAVSVRLSRRSQFPS